jgi:hypothetical protein
VVARHEDRFPSATEPRADRPQDGLGGRHRLHRSPFQKFDDVAEQHQPLDAVERVEQRLERLRVAQHIAPQAGAEMKIRHHEGAHLATIAHPACAAARAARHEEPGPARHDVAVPRARL